MNLPPPDFEDPSSAVSAAIHEAPTVQPAPAVLPAAHRARPSPPALSADDLVSLIKDAATYPWRRDGGMTLVSGALCALVMTAGPFILFGGPFIMVFGAWYFAAYYFEVIGTTMTGRDSPPDWPSLSNGLDSIFWPGLQMLGVALISSLPEIAIASFTASEEGSFLRLAGAAFAWLYLPMATLAVVYFGSLSQALPHRVLPAIRACMPSYLVASGILACSHVVTETIVGLSTGVPLLGSLFAWVITFYTAIVQARFLGTLHRRHAVDLDW
ncbi:MAG: hypothetical protein KDK99_11080 [Verrucomicrobiales bacterium]|nr:hypothetical protein [Verrucomicrobiales bacterium]